MPVSWCPRQWRAARRRSRRGDAELRVGVAARGHPHGRMGRMPVKLPRQRGREPETPGVRGVARVDARTKNLTRRLRPGEIAVIDHQDIDKVSAEALLACRPAAVINASPSISGRYPNLGPEILVDAGIPLIDNVGKDVMHDLEEGQLV